MRKFVSVLLNPDCEWRQKKLHTSHWLSDAKHHPAPLHCCWRQPLGFWGTKQLFCLLGTRKRLIAPTPEFTEPSESSWAPPFPPQREKPANSSCEEKEKPPWLLVKISHGKRAGNSWVVIGIAHSPIKMCSSLGENTLHGTALCSSHPESQLNCSEGVKGNNIPPEESRSFL